MLTNVIRCSGLSALLGGTLITVHAAIAASMPRGCIGDVECATRKMRDTGGIDTLLMLGFLLVMLGALGLVLRLQEAGRFGWLGRAGAIFGTVGLVLGILASITSALTDSMSPLMPLFVVPGLFAIIIGFFLLAVATLNARTLPQPTVLLLIVSLLAMFTFNDQNWQVLLAVPFGVAWAAVGYALWSQKDASSSQPARAS